MTSAANAFMGATYTTLKDALSIMPPRICRPTSRRTATMAILVFPAPVGAHTRMFSLEPNAVVKMRLWMRFSVLHLSAVRANVYWHQHHGKLMS